MRDKVAPFERSTLLEDQAREITEFAQKIREQYPSVINLGKQIAKDMPLQSQIQAHVQKYDWFGTHHWMCEGYSYEKCIADIEAAIRENRHIEKKTESGDADAHADLWQLIAQSIYWRTHCAEITAKVVYRSRARLTEIAKSFGITYDDLLYLSAREILEQIEQDTFEFPHDFAERKNAYGCVVEGSTENIIVGNELHETIQRYVDFGDTDTTELKGSVASKGKTARGRARVMLAPEDFARFQTGDILIASETTPDFVPIMKKAAAIVTEVGGITSHAAVISRELGKPCIIGTKTATRVFPEGAMIEVDTERGIVRKI
jgi:phosphohistidine swiveling domain-containing protein